MTRPRLCQLCSDDGGKTLRELPLEHGLHCGDLRDAYDRGRLAALTAAIALCDAEAHQRERNAETYRESSAHHTALAYTMAAASVRKLGCLLREKL